jgi:hypothetical protein
MEQLAYRRTLFETDGVKFFYFLTSSCMFEQ